jgi:hypothetical protein
VCGDADAHPPREFYIQCFETCQLYIGILGGKDSSGTEEEYREAVITGFKSA